MTVSYPSKPIHVFDSPEVENVEVQFYYNFFASDEKINESGFEKMDPSLPSDFQRAGNASFRSATARIPRFNVLRINYSDSTRKMDPAVGRGVDLSARRGELEEAISSGRVVTETNVSSKVYSAFTLGDTGINNEIENLMRLALNKHMVKGDSPSSAIDSLSEMTNVDSETLSRMLPPTMNDGVPMSKHLPISTQEGGIEKNRAQVQLNSRFAPMMLRKSVVRGTSLLDGYLNSNFMTATSIFLKTPELANTMDEAFKVDEGDSLFDIPFFREPEFLPLDKEFSAQSAVAGVLIEKTRILDGKRYKMPSIIVPGLRPQLVMDTKIAYGQTYEYTVRTLSIYKIPITTDDGTRLLATYLIASKESQPFQVTATEDVAPNPPSDIDFFYNYGSDSLTIFWKPPTNPQMDVKYYQVFRRKSINEPFELIGMLDFDDSIIRTLPVETIDPSLVTAYPGPRYTFIDNEFDREGDFIYAVVSVDARQLSSLYSTQVKVTFDSQKNKINKELVCRQGAPKQYPNWTKKENFFVDTMKDSAHKKVRIYFDPEAYTVIDSSGVASPLFLAKSHDRSAKYVFQFINTDRLSEQRFEIKIDDTPFVEGDVGYGPKPQGKLTKATATMKTVKGAKMTKMSLLK